MRAVLRSCGDSALTWQNLSANCQVAGRPAIFDLPQSGRWQAPKNGQNQRFFAVLVVTLRGGSSLTVAEFVCKLSGLTALLPCGYPATKSVSSLSPCVVRCRVSGRFSPWFPVFELFSGSSGPSLPN